MIRLAVFIKGANEEIGKAPSPDRLPLPIPRPNPVPVVALMRAVGFRRLVELGVYWNQPFDSPIRVEWLGPRLVFVALGVGRLLCK